MKADYDYIIAGAGCAGLSLLARMMQHPFFSSKKILLVDKSSKQTNDRTWCFWEERNGFFQHLVQHEWKQIDFYADKFSARFDLKPYTYKLIRGIDLYDDVLSKANQLGNITISNENVEELSNEDDVARVRTTSNEYTSQYIFSSLQVEEINRTDNYYLLQHFKGWFIKTNKPAFNERIATFMDFRNSEHGDSFFYMLPVSANEALIEYTFFNDTKLPWNEYDQPLKNYIHQVLKIKNYTIEHEETGVIPMTDYVFSKGEENIIHIGAAAGNTKPSSGFTFQFIQKHSDKIIEALINQQHPLLKQSFAEKRFRVYDSTMLNILSHHKMIAADVFARLFKRNETASILRFLDNDTSFKEELKIMQSMPLIKFTPTFFKELITYKS